MRFVPYVYAKDSVRLPVVVKSMTAADAQRTNQPPLWQTSWTSDYLSDDRLEKYAVQLDDELIGLGAYEINDDSLIVHIVYMEAQPESNPTIVGDARKYRGIGRLLIGELLKFINDHGVEGTEIFVELCAMPDKIPFYEKFGFSANEAQRLRLFHRVENGGIQDDQGSKA